ncbi:MAG: hypothetical protein HEP71_04610 [Roseivirga sp.]|nr:hypothetical protein [Roseivirga sp.]
MELNFEQDRQISLDSAENQAIPRTNARPVVRIWSVTAPSLQATRLKECIFDLLPLYWASPGIIDCKILEDQGQHSFIIIESWQNRESQQDFQESHLWIESQKSFSSLRGITLKEITNNIFELIE